MVSINGKAEHTSWVIRPHSHIDAPGWGVEGSDLLQEFLFTVPRARRTREGHPEPPPLEPESIKITVREAIATGRTCTHEPDPHAAPSKDIVASKKSGVASTVAIGGAKFSDGRVAGELYDEFVTGQHLDTLRIRYTTKERLQGASRLRLTIGSTVACVVFWPGSQPVTCLRASFLTTFAHILRYTVLC